MVGWRRWCLRAGLVDDPGHRKIHHAPVPLAGGLAVLTGLAAPLAAGVIALKSGLVASQTTDLLSYGLSRRALELTAILFGALGMVTLGCWDDKHELRPAVKFAGQSFIALVVAAAGVRITLFVHSTPFSYAITVLWILTVTNAFNFMDNMNGLCAGLGTIAASCFAMIAAADGQYLVALISFVSAGALLGFLPYNYPKAGAFLGVRVESLPPDVVDDGFELLKCWSQPDWFLALAICYATGRAFRNDLIGNGHVKSSANNAQRRVVVGRALVPVMLRQPCRHLGRFYQGDTNHLSHRLVRRGWSQPAAVLLIWLLAAFTGGLALL